MEKSLQNTDSDPAKKNVSDLVIWGQDGMFELLSKASSVGEGWMKSTKAMEIIGVGCVVQVTTHQINREFGHPDTHVIAEAVTFVPDVKIVRTLDENDNIIGRRLEKNKV